MRLRKIVLLATAAFASLLGIAQALAQNAYITNSDTVGTVSVINTATNSVTATITVRQGPVGVAVSPDGRKVYVANGGSGTVSVIDTATNAVTAEITVGVEPSGVAVSPDGSKLYVANG
jgi:YVTN family beta-propeller protein